jgi:hypothetical protein
MASIRVSDSSAIHDRDEEQIQFSSSKRVTAKGTLGTRRKSFPSVSFPFHCFETKIGYE